VSRYKLTKYLVLSHVAETSNGHLSSVAIQTSTKPGLSQGTQVLLGADAGIRVYIVLLICQDSKSTCLPASRICKNRENLFRTAGNLFILLSMLASVYFHSSGIVAESFLSELYTISDMTLFKNLDLLFSRYIGFFGEIFFRSKLEY